MTDSITSRARLVRGFAVVVGATGLAGCVAIPTSPTSTHPATPAPTVNAGQPTASPPGDGHTIVVTATGDGQRIVRWAARDHVEERTARAGEEFQTTLYATEPDLIVVTVVGDGPGPVACSITVDGGTPTTTWTEESGAESDPVAICVTGAPPLPEGYEPSESRAHRVHLSTITTGGGLSAWATENGASISHTELGGRSTELWDGIDHGPVMVAAVSIDGTSRCELTMGSGTLVTTADEPGEIAFCYATFPYPTPGG